MSESTVVSNRSLSLSGISSSVIGDEILLRHFAAIIATIVEHVVESIVGTNIAAGSDAPAAALTLITPSGSSVTLEVLIARNRHIASVA